MTFEEIAEALKEIEDGKFDQIARDDHRVYMRDDSDIDALLARFQALGIPSSWHNTKTEYLSGKCAMHYSVNNKPCGSGSKTCRVNVANAGTVDAIVWAVCK